MDSHINWAPLMESATPSVFRTNAFRLLELPVDAEPREISKRQQVLEVAAKMGLEVPAGIGRALPLAQTTPEERREALQRLSNPERRLIEELFWFWPQQPGKSGEDLALAALVRGDVKAAESAWEAAARQQDAVAAHNLAILHHARALDAVHDGNGNGHADGWKRTFDTWRQTLSRPEFWTRIGARVLELDDPRLTRDTVQHLRDGLPRSLLTITAQLAVQCAERSDLAAAKRHADAMRKSQFDARLVDEVLAVALEPTRSRIKLLCETAENSADKEPRKGHEAAARLITLTEPLLQVIDTLLPTDSPTREAMHDEVALRLLGCQVSYANKTQSWERSKRLLERAIKIAQSDTARQRLQKNLDIVAKNVTSGGDWCGEEYWDLPEAAVERLEEARRHAVQGDHQEALDILVEMAMGRSVPVLSPAERAAPRRAIAWVLNQRSVKRVNASQSDDIAPGLERVVNNVKNRSHDPRLVQTLVSAKLGFAASCDDLICVSCMTKIISRFVQVTFRDVKVILCPSCSEGIERFQNSKRDKMRAALREAAQDLLYSQELLPGDAEAERHLDTVRTMARELDVSLPTRHSRAEELGMVPLAELLRRSPGRLRALDDAWLQAGAAEFVGDVVLLLGGSNQERKLGADLLARMGKAARLAIPRLLELMADENQGTRTLARQTLDRIDPGWRNAPEFVEAMTALVVESLLGATEEARERAGRRLNELDTNWRASKAAERAVPRVMGEIARPDPQVRHAIVTFLDAVCDGWIGSAAGVALVAPCVAQLAHESVAMREAAADALRVLAPVATAAVPALVGAIGDPEPRVRYAAVHALAALPAAALRAPQTAQRVTEVVAVLEAPPSSDEAVVAARLAALKVLEQVGLAARHVVPRLINTLANLNDDERRRQLALLDQLDPRWRQSPALREAKTRFVVLLASDSEQQRSQAEQLLVALDPNWRQSPEARAAISSLVMAMLDDEARALAVLESLSPAWASLPEAAAALPLLAHVLEEDAKKRRCGACSIIARFGTHGAAMGDALVPLVESSSGPVQLAAVAALVSVRPDTLGTVVTARHAEAAATAVTARNALTVWAGMLALAAMGPFASDALPILIAHLASAPTDWEQNLTALGRISPEWTSHPAVASAHQQLAEMLVGTDVATRARARQILDPIDPSWPRSPHTLAAAPKLLAALVGRDDARATAAQEVLALIAPNWHTAAWAREAIPEVLQGLPKRKRVSWSRLSTLLQTVRPDWTGMPEAEALLTPLAETVTDDDDAQREGAARLLGAAAGNSPRAAQALVLAIADSTPAVREIVQAWLGSLAPGSPVAAELVRPLLEQIGRLGLEAAQQVARHLDRLVPGWPRSPAAQAVVGELQLQAGKATGRRRQFLERLVERINPLARLKRSRKPLVKAGVAAAVAVLAVWLFWDSARYSSDSAMRLHRWGLANQARTEERLLRQLGEAKTGAARAARVAALVALPVQQRGARTLARFCAGEDSSCKSLALSRLPDDVRETFVEELVAAARDPAALGLALRLVKDSPDAIPATAWPTLLESSQADPDGENAEQAASLLSRAACEHGSASTLRRPELTKVLVGRLESACAGTRHDAECAALVTALGCLDSESEASADLLFAQGLTQEFNPRLAAPIGEALCRMGDRGRLRLELLATPCAAESAPRYSTTSCPRERRDPAPVVRFLDHPNRDVRCRARRVLEASYADWTGDPSAQTLETAVLERSQSDCTPKRLVDSTTECLRDIDTLDLLRSRQAAALYQRLRWHRDGELREAVATAQTNLIRTPRPRRPAPTEPTPRPADSNDAVFAGLKATLTSPAPRRPAPTAPRPTPAAPRPAAAPPAPRRGNDDFY